MSNKLSLKLKDYPVGEPMFHTQARLSIRAMQEIVRVLTAYMGPNVVFADVEVVLNLTFTQPKDAPSFALYKPVEESGWCVNPTSGDPLSGEEKKGASPC